MSTVVQKLTVVSTSINIDCLAFAIRHVIFPLAFIFVSASVIVFTISVSYIVPQITLKIASILLDIPTSPLTTTVDELSLKVISIVVLNGSETTRHIVLILSNIGPFDDLKINSFAVLEP